MEYLVGRFERNGEVYPFIDTKFDPTTGEERGNAPELFRSRECIYTWIQGRGLESIARHIGFFAAHGDAELARRLIVMLGTVTDSMEKLRALNHGRLPFALRPGGEAFFSSDFGYANFSDLFYSRGLYLAGCALGRDDYRTAGKELFLFVLQAIVDRSFRTDQQSFDPKNAVAYVPGKYPQGPAMISLSGIAEILAAEPENEKISAFVAPLLGRILNYHINHGQYPQLEKFDFIENLDAEFAPYYETNGALASDPGHALELVGLAGKLLLVLQKNHRLDAELKNQAAILPEVFCHVFDYGFNAHAGGIAKLYDLAARKTINSDMPWWSLPETFRAGVEMTHLYPDIRQAEVRTRAEAAFAAIAKFRGQHGFCVQTRDASGKLIPVIPAVPDIDPGYHTNLALLDAAELL